jgi:ribosomal-protein-alanine N-acetyltransferase
MPSITRYERPNYRAVLDLIYSQQHVHTHFDWYTAERWLDQQSVPVLLAWEGPLLMGVLGASDPLNGASWLRLMVVRDSADRAAVMSRLWDIMRESLRGMGVREVWLLATSDWVKEVAPVFDARQAETIITLRRTEIDLPPVLNHDVRVRPVHMEQDLGEITRVDHAAFTPPWQLAQSDLRQAIRIASSCTLALLDGEVVGYQLSTRHRESGHLARLAVVPGLQGSGVGGALLNGLLAQFSTRGVHTMTVNTQNSNTRSQRLYSYYHFQRNGYDLPAWLVTL